MTGEVCVAVRDGMVVIDGSNGTRVGLEPRVALQLADRLTLAAEWLQDGRLVSARRAASNGVGRAAA